jgi:hypothetical protein
LHAVQSKGGAKAKRRRVYIRKLRREAARLSSVSFCEADFSHGFIYPTPPLGALVALPISNQGLIFSV